MPQLSEAKQRVLLDAFKANLDAAEIFNLVDCGLSTIYRLRLCWECFGVLYPPTCAKIGRPSTFTDAEEAVSGLCAMVV